MNAIKFNPKMCRTLNLERLALGMPGISPRRGASFAEAASVCLEETDHHPGVTMQIDGDCKHYVQVVWNGAAGSTQNTRAWNDPEEATEDGAYGVAALLITELSEYTVVERSRKGTGFDYWLGRKDAPDPLFQEKARLEVSGIRSGDQHAINARVRRKIDQTKVSNGLLPGVIVVVEFGSPRTRVKTI